ncbi:MAG: hypothetical protein EOO06_15395 [Chitinophagaceae bacterium]|nr:MAG: hypothetical protein EOO06_15395 [Chitinophagaceae bacterium]
MKKLFLTSGTVFCLVVGALAQAPAKPAAKKTSTALTTAPVAAAPSREESEARLKEKLKHYEAMKAAAAPAPAAAAPVNERQSARKAKRAN